MATYVDLVTVTTDGLARRYGEHGRVEVIPNGVPQFAIDAPSWRHLYDPEFTVGWAGYTATHPGDCVVSAEAAQAVVGAGGRARAIADAQGVSEAWGVPVDPVPPQRDEYYASLSSMDLMLVGLKETPFNRCKSYLKVLEAGSAGVPAIASATAPHRVLKKSGFPVYLAESSAEWRVLAEWMMKDEESYDQMRRAVKEAMPAHTIEARAEEWAQAWERARNRADKR